MSALTTDSGVEAGAGSLGPADLAELMAAFNDVTGKLEQTHAQLRGEVHRLNAELREANEQLERSRRLAALGEMAAGISHEIRNPLGSIRLYVRMLEDDLSDRPAECEIAGKIAGAVARLDAVVTDVLAFAREIRVRHEPVEAAALFAQALEMCELGGIEVRREASDVALECDPHLLHQALVNLVRNAAEAMRDAGGPGLLSLAASEAPASPDGIERPMVVLSVRDSGPGVAPEVIERMFNPFFTTRTTGTGLGLAIVHRIVDAHGGHVVVTNNEQADAGGCGATVSLWLPVRQGAVVESSPEVTTRSVGVSKQDRSAERHAAA